MLRPPALQRRILLISATVAMLTPFTDTIVLPALPAMRASLPGGDADSDAAIISVYMAAVGLFTLVWGPLSDCVGRRAPLLATLAAFVASTVGCVFAPSAWGLVGLRAMQGAFVGSTIVVTMATVADGFAPAERSTAIGLYFAPLLSCVVAQIMSPLSLSTSRTAR